MRGDRAAMVPMVIGSPASTQRSLLASEHMNHNIVITTGTIVRGDSFIKSDFDNTPKLGT